MRSTQQGQMVSCAPPRACLFAPEAHATRSSLASGADGFSRPPAANAACHAHSLHGKAWSAFGRPIDTYVQDACAFHDDLAVYTEFGGVVLSGGEGDKIAEALGTCKAVLLQNHGQLTVGQTIDEAVAWYIFLDHLCQTQLLIEAAAAGGKRPVPIDPEVATWTRSVTGTPSAGWNGAQVYYDMMEAETGGAHRL